MLLVERQEVVWLVKTERWGAGMELCLERGADLHTAQLMPLPLTVFCFSKNQIGFAFLVPAHPSSPEKRAIKRVWDGKQCSHFRCHRDQDSVDQILLHTNTRLTALCPGLPR